MARFFVPLRTNPKLLALWRFSCKILLPGGIIIETQPLVDSECFAFLLSCEEDDKLINSFKQAPEGQLNLLDAQEFITL